MHFLCVMILSTFTTSLKASLTVFTQALIHVLLLMLLMWVLLCPVIHLQCSYLGLLFNGCYFLFIFWPEQLFQSNILSYYLSEIQLYYNNLQVSKTMKWSFILIIFVQAKGLGYAMNTAEELEFVKDVAKATGIVLDPVYR